MGQEWKLAGCKGRLPHRLWVILAILLPVLAFGLFGALLTFIHGGQHHAWGIVVSALALLVAAGFLWGTYDQLRLLEIADPVPSVSFLNVYAFSTMAVALLLCAGAEVSFSLARWGVAVYGSSQEAVTYPGLLGTYAWFLADLVPFIDPSKLFGFAGPPLQPIGWWAGAPVLAFQAVVVIYFFDVLRRSWLLYQKNSTRAFYRRLGIKEGDSSSKDHEANQ